MGEKMSTPPDSVEMTSTDDDDARATETVTLRSLTRIVGKRLTAALGGTSRRTVER
jgi:hypothetical protein